MKKSSYKKLKQRIAELESQLNIVVFSPKSTEAFNISTRLAFKKDTTEAIMYGGREGIGNSIIDQLINGPVKMPTINDVERVVNEIKFNPPILKIRTGKKLIELLNKMASSTSIPADDKRFTTLFGVPIEEVSYYPDNFFTMGNKHCWIEEDEIKIVDYPYKIYNKTPEESIKAFTQ